MSQRIIDRSYVGEVLQRIYSSDLHMSVSLTCNGGYFYLETKNGRVSLHGPSVEEAVTHLASVLVDLFPTSTFSEWWINNFCDDNHDRQPEE